MAPRKKAATGDGAHQRLTSYERKRDFDKTPEPSGRGDGEKSGAPGGPRFVVQRHRARRLHYDLRFEIDGVLASWAVPKGPTLDPDVKHAAIHVEDHPIEYLNFEGTIPSGQYGGGDVIVWDTGTWGLHAADDAAAAVRDGELHADVFGEKLKGRFILIRRDGLGEPGKEQWLLFHKHDEYAVKGWDPEDHPKSVLSGRTNDEVKADPERMWRSDLPPSKASVPADSAETRGSTGRRVIGGAETKQSTTKQARPRAKATHQSDNSKKSGEADNSKKNKGGGHGRARSRSSDDDDAGGAGPEELAALDDLGDAGTWEVFGQRLRLTNLDKELFPARRAGGGRQGEPAVTKREFIAYAARLAPG